MPHIDRLRHAVGDDGRRYCAWVLLDPVSDDLALSHAPRVLG